MSDMGYAPMGDACPGKINSFSQQLDVLRGFLGRLDKCGAEIERLSDALDGQPPVNINKAEVQNPQKPTSLVEQLAETVTACHDRLSTIDTFVNRISSRLG